MTDYHPWQKAPSRLIKSPVAADKKRPILKARSTQLLDSSYKVERLELRKAMKSVRWSLHGGSGEIRDRTTFFTQLLRLKREAEALF